jgi:hypothetical protein
MSKPEVDMQAGFVGMMKDWEIEFLEMTTEQWACPCLRLLTEICPADGFLEHCRKRNGLLKEPVNPKHRSL